jgi:hypothetical protein
MQLRGEFYSICCKDKLRKTKKETPLTPFFLLIIRSRRQQQKLSQTSENNGTGIFSPFVYKQTASIREEVHEFLPVINALALRMTWVFTRRMEITLHPKAPRFLYKAVCATFIIQVETVAGSTTNRCCANNFCSIL